MKPIRDIEEAKAIMKGGLGRAELEFVASLTAPFAWVVRLPEGRFRTKSGSRVFGVTAAHVTSEWVKDLAAQAVVSSFIGSRSEVILPINPSRMIDSDIDIDITTLAISEQEVASIGHTILTGYQKDWPPKPPQVDRGIYYCGFPGITRTWISLREISFGSATGSGVASSVNEIDISSLIERENLIPTLGRGLPPENFDFRGISGGPMLSVVENGILRGWALAGVIVQGPNTSDDVNEAIAGLEIIKARRAHFILPDGKLDRTLWSTINWSKPR